MDGHTPVQRDIAEPLITLHVEYSGKDQRVQKRRRHVKLKNCVIRMDARIYKRLDQL